LTDEPKPETNDPKPETSNPQEPTGDAEPEIYELEPEAAATGSTGSSPARDKNIADATAAPPETGARTGESPIPPGEAPAASGAVSVSSDETPPPKTAMAKTPDAPFTSGIGGIRFAMTTGAVLLLLALIMTGVSAGDTQLSALMLTLAATFLTIVVNGALGTLAVIAAARCVGTRVAEPELFALRMLAASAAFMLLYETGTPIPTRIDDFILGLAAYATTVWLLFRLPPRETGLVIVWHAGLVALLALNTSVGTRAATKTTATDGPPALEAPAGETIPSID
jgi:hypothetical protein